jgi:UDP-glucose 4-epimerase
MKFLVTGSSGFIGNHLRGRLLEEGHQVISFDLKYAQDIRDYNDLCYSAQGCEVILHQASAHLIASKQRPEEDLLINTMGALNVLKVAKLTGARVVMASTGSVLGKDGIPGTPYGISKLAAEKYSLYFYREEQVPVTVLRYFSVYGPGMPTEKRGVIGIFIRNCLEKKTLVVEGGSQRRAFCFVDDVVKANKFVVEHDETIGKVYDVGTTEEISVLDLALKIKSMYGDEETAIDTIPPRSGDDYRAVPDISKLGELGWKPEVSLEEGIKRVHDWIC